MNIKRGDEAFDANHLHTHFNQDGFGADVLVCYGIMSLWDMDRRTGATQIVPGSHKPENVEKIQSYRKQQGIGKEEWESMGESERRNFTDAYTSIGLQPGILNVTAGDLVFFDTALYHGVCHAEDPIANGPENLLRAIFIQSSKSRLSNFARAISNTQVVGYVADSGLRAYCGDSGAGGAPRKRMG